MASGNLSLLITDEVSWESFPVQAKKFVRRFNGKVLWRADTPAERMWIVFIKGRPFWLTFDDFPLGLSLDAMISFCNPVLRDLHHVLSANGA